MSDIERIRAILVDRGFHEPDCPIRVAEKQNDLGFWYVKQNGPCNCWIENADEEPVSDNVPLVERVAYLLWQVNQGYILPEDREIGTNWFAEPVEMQHLDDQKERPGWIALAEEVIEAVRVEIDKP